MMPGELSSLPETDIVSYVKKVGYKGLTRVLRDQIDHLADAKLGGVYIGVCCNQLGNRETKVLRD